MAIYQSKMLFMGDKDGNEGAEINKQARYIFNFERGIVIKKKQALQLLEGLKVKAFDTGDDRNIHFSDVYRCLVKRLLHMRNFDYKLTPTLNKKFLNYWSGRFKDINYEKRGKFSVQKIYAGTIIASWAKKLSNH